MKAVSCVYKLLVLFILHSPEVSCNSLTPSPKFIVHISNPHSNSSEIMGIGR